MSLKTVKQLSEEIAQRAKSVRLKEKLTQGQLSERAGIPLSTYKRFEQKGLISFESLIKVAIALRVENALDSLFTLKVNETEFTSLAEVEKALSTSSSKNLHFNR